jgi:hypothetical protein
MYVYYFDALVIDTGRDLYYQFAELQILLSPFLKEEVSLDEYRRSSALRVAVHSSTLCSIHLNSCFFAFFNQLP